MHHGVDPMHRRAYLERRLNAAAVTVGLLTRDHEWFNWSMGNRSWLDPRCCSWNATLCGRLFHTRYTCAHVQRDGPDNFISARAERVIHAGAHVGDAAECAAPRCNQTTGGDTCMQVD